MVEESLRDFNYLKQYIERNLNINSLNQDIEWTDQIRENFTETIIGNVEFIDYNNTEMGIDVGGLRPEFFRNIGKDMINTFLQTITEKDAYEARKITSQHKMETYLRDKLKEKRLEYKPKHNLTSQFKTTDNVNNYNSEDQMRNI